MDFNSTEHCRTSEIMVPTAAATSESTVPTEHNFQGKRTHGPGRTSSFCQQQEAIENFKNNSTRNGRRILLVVICLVGHLL